MEVVGVHAYPMLEQIAQCYVREQNGYSQTAIAWAPLVSLKVRSALDDLHRNAWK